MTNNLFSLNLPDHWKETTIYSFEGPYHKGIKHNLILLIERNVDPDISIKDFATKHLSDSRETMPGFGIVHENEAVNSDGLPVYSIVFKYVPISGLEYFQKQYYIRKDTSIFLFTSTFNSDTFKSASTEVDEIVSSLVVLEYARIA